MRIIQILITMFSLLYAGLRGNAQTTAANDTVKVSYKGRTYKIETNIEPGEDEKSKTLKFVDTLKKNTVLVTVTSRANDGHSIIIDDDDNADDTGEAARLQKKIVKLMKKSREDKRKHFIETSFLPTFDIGFASTMNDIENSNAFNPRLGKSVNLNIGLVKQDMNLYRERILFSYGLSLNNYYLKYSNKQMVQYIDNQGHLRAFNDSINNYDKNRLDVRYLSVPVLLEYHSANDNFSIAAGVEFGFNGHSKVVLKGDRQSLEFKQKNSNDIKISPEQLNALLKIGIHNVELFARYSITDMYRPSAYATDQNPHQHLFSFGVCLFGI